VVRICVSSTATPDQRPGPVPEVETEEAVSSMPAIMNGGVLCENELA
jgi:hypothetical protein